MPFCGGTELDGGREEDHAVPLALLELTLTSLHIASRLLGENDTLLIGKLTRPQLKTKSLQTKISSGFHCKNFFWHSFKYFAGCCEVVITMRRAMK